MCVVPNNPYANQNHIGLCAAGCLIRSKWMYEPLRWTHPPLLLLLYRLFNIVLSSSERRRCHWRSLPVVVIAITVVADAAAATIINIYSIVIVIILIRLCLTFRHLGSIEINLYSDIHHTAHNTQTEILLRCDKYRRTLTSFILAIVTKPNVYYYF